jgi:outer membrane protein
MKRTTLATAATLLALLSTQAFAEDNWLVRVRAVNLSPADKSDPVGGTGAADRLHVSSKTNVAVELLLTIPQKHTVTLDGASVGTFKHLPPTLLGQYHFAPEAQLSPYVGAGINYTLIHGVDLLGGKGGLEHSSVGLALQAGVDFKIDKKWSFNIDVKKIQIRSDVTAGGAKISAVKVDPLLVGVGVGYRF